MKILLIIQLSIINFSIFAVILNNKSKILYTVLTSVDIYKPPKFCRSELRIFAIIGSSESPKLIRI